MTIPFSLASLDRIAGLADTFPTSDVEAARAARARQERLTKPPGALGLLEELAIFMAGWQGTPQPALERAQALVFAGNHGVCAQGVNAFPQAVTAQMVQNFRAGGAAINQLCAVNGAALSVVPLDLDKPTRDFTAEPAMSEAECLDALNRGAEAVAPDADILVLGEMGIGNSTVAAALACALFGGRPADWVGPGAGADDAGMARKIAAIEAGLARQPARDPLAVLCSLGGREQAAICGAM
ncbi:MAG: nicotinate-nucleotide--dimethylbenzimidazole phosphoribosyltransferase, partial [Dichotomicrobium sp.]